jgi:hypothetical protein
MNSETLCALEIDEPALPPARRLPPLKYILTVLLFLLATAAIDAIFSFDITSQIKSFFGNETASAVAN